jgi:hypothetical protein
MTLVTLPPIITGRIRARLRVNTSLHSVSYHPAPPVDLPQEPLEQLAPFNTLFQFVHDLFWLRWSRDLRKAFVRISRRVTSRAYS